MKKINFYAGPSFINEDVMERAIELISKEGKLSLLEVSHRSESITSLFDETKSLIKELMELDDAKEILFLHGGASLQFGMIPLNIETNKTAGFIDTGIWSQKAIKEAKKIRKVRVFTSKKNDTYNSILDFDGSEFSELGYLHLTSNNTIYGTQFNEFPKCETPLVVDMSSDILSRKLDYNQFDLIFAGFQKNLGTTGGCLVIVNKDIIDTKEDELLSMLDYKVHIKAKSMFNTPPVFSVLMCNLTLKWIKKIGGFKEIERRNLEKAKLLYDEIERNNLFYCEVFPKDRSMMNVCFIAKTKSIEQTFLLICEKNNIVGIKGHRIKGGFRASLYNAMPLDDVKFLVDLMQKFEKDYTLNTFKK